MVRDVHAVATQGAPQDLAILVHVRTALFVGALVHHILETGVWIDCHPELFSALVYSGRSPDGDTLDLYKTTVNSFLHF
jgi:hypothetical protein